VATDTSLADSPVGQVVESVLQPLTSNVRESMQQSGWMDQNGAPTDKFRQIGEASAAHDEVAAQQVAGVVAAGAASVMSTSTYTLAEFQGRRVYQREVDWSKTDRWGRTNLQRAQEGDSPLGDDGKAIVLHHILQDEPGPMAEVTDTVHRRGLSILHGLRGPGDSFRNNRDLLNQFQKFRDAYWKWRASLVTDEESQ
jgi:hypothetical protein